MSEGLCWRCRDEWDVPKGPWVHCHHEAKEKEREKLKCWCEYDRPRKKLRSFEDGEVDLNFCPECGRKL